MWLKSMLIHYQYVKLEVCDKGYQNMCEPAAAWSLSSAYLEVGATTTSNE